MRLTDCEIAVGFFLLLIKQKEQILFVKNIKNIFAFCAIYKIYSKLQNIFQKFDLLR